MTKVRLWGSFASALALAIAWPAVAGPLDFAPTTAIPLPGGKNIIGFDISFVDPTIGLYLLGDRTNKAVDVVDTASNALKALIPATPPFAGATGNNNTSGPDGVMTVRHREVWAGDGPSVVKVIDLFSQQTTHVISTGGQFRTDEMCVDPQHNIALTANNADDPPFATFINAITHTVITSIKFDGTVNGGSVNPTPKATNGIEQCQWDPRTRHFFISVPEVNGPGNNSVAGAVAEFDPATHVLVNTFIIPFTSCSGPQGMAVGPFTALGSQLLLGCNGASGDGLFSTAIIDSHGGTLIATVNGQSGADEVAFNSGDGKYFLARSSANGPNQLLGIIDSVTFASNSVITANKSIAGRNAHSVAADPVHNQVYVPIPAGVSTICGSNGGSDANGCIAVFTNVDP